MIKFSSRIYKLGINPVVDPPDSALEKLFKLAGKDKGPIPVRGRLNGAEFIQTLVKYQGTWRLYINGQMLKDSGLKVGDGAKIELEYDRQRRQYAMPPVLERALKNDAEMRTSFKSLSPSRQTEIVRYFGSLKSETALLRNIEKLRSKLIGK